jgi:hypothetical protein
MIFLILSRPNLSDENIVVINVKIRVKKTSIFNAKMMV